MNKTRVILDRDFTVGKTDEPFSVRLLNISAEPYTAAFLSRRIRLRMKTGSAPMYWNLSKKQKYPLSAIPAVTLCPVIIGATV